MTKKLIWAHDASRKHSRRNHLLRTSKSVGRAPRATVCGLMLFKPREDPYPLTGRIRLKRHALHCGNCVKVLGWR